MCVPDVRIRMPSGDPTGQQSDKDTSSLPELPNDRALLFDILARAGHDGRDAHLFIQLIEDMASANLIDRFETKLETKLEALNDKFNLLLWLIGVGLTVGVGVTVAIFLTLLDKI